MWNIWTNANHSKHHATTCISIENTRNVLLFFRLLKAWNLLINTIFSIIERSWPNKTQKLKVFQKKTYVYAHKEMLAKLFIRFFLSKFWCKADLTSLRKGFVLKFSIIKSSIDPLFKTQVSVKWNTHENHNQSVLWNIHLSFSLFFLGQCP